MSGAILAVALAFLIPAFNIAAIIALTLLPSDDALPVRRIGAEIAQPSGLGLRGGSGAEHIRCGPAPWLLTPLDWLGKDALALGPLSIDAGFADAVLRLLLIFAP